MKYTGMGLYLVSMQLMSRWEAIYLSNVAGTNKKCMGIVWRDFVSIAKDSQVETSYL